MLQAEAVVDLIDARSPAFHSAAIHQMERGLSARIVQLREEIIHAEALVSYGIDFPDEDEPPVPKETILASADAALRRIEMLIGSAPQGEMLRKGALVVLAGLPNSGKSSLFNALLGSDRAIVTEIPGTTRDAVEADATIEGYPFRLVDTAGLRETSDRVEALGIEVARRYLAAAELVLFCSPAGGSLETSERQFLQDLNSERVLVVRTKTDLIGGGAEPDPALNAVELSAHSGEGLGVLRERLVTRAFGAARMDFDSPLVTSERQLRALRSAAAEVRGFIDGLADEVPAEFAATHLRSAAEALEELIGAVTTDDVLSAIFGRFCVGK